MSLKTVLKNQHSPNNPIEVTNEELIKNADKKQSYEPEKHKENTGNGFKIES